MPAEALIQQNEEVEEIKKLKNFNDRNPEEGEFSRKMFTFGWKFNMFNEVS